jgi:hypothetical protein
MTKDGGPAFPVEANISAQGYARLPAFPGMSLRDWFAGQALLTVGDMNPNLPGDPATGYWPEPDDLVMRRAKWAYLQADAMLAARETTP